MSQLLEYLVENEPSFRKARLPALYSDFQSQRTLNPDGYQANVSAWRRALARIARSGLAPSPRGEKPSVLVLHCDEQLLRALESKQYGRPLALGAVVREALGQKDLMPLREFLQARESIYHRGWSVWKLAGWAVERLGVGDVFLRGGKMPEGEFVVVANVEEVGKMFVEEVMKGSGEGSRFERTFSRAHFYRSFGGRVGPEGGLSEGDMDVLLRFMERDKGVVLWDGEVVKIRIGGVEGEEREITEEDRSVAQLKELLASLRHQTGILSLRVEELSRGAKEAVKRGNRVAALAAIKSRKIAEGTLEKRFETVNRLEEVAARIETAADNVQMVRVMEASGEALRSLHDKVGGVERVEEVVGRLREQMAAADEVNSILAEESGVVVDEGEIDDELAAMEGEERTKVEEAERKRAEEEREKRESESEKEAEETRRRLEAVEGILGGKLVQGESEAERMMSRMSLEEGPYPQAG